MSLLVANVGVMRRSGNRDKFLILGVDNSLIMRTLNITISDLEYEKFGIKTEQLSFTDFVDIISRELSRQNLKKEVALSVCYGLSNMRCASHRLLIANHWYFQRYPTHVSSSTSYPQKKYLRLRFYKPPNTASNAKRCSV